MYAHQVIERLETVRKSSDELQEVSDINKFLVSLIQKSQRFHFGDYEILTNAIEKYADVFPAFTGRCGEDIRLPYDVCWFDYFHKPIQGGCNFDIFGREKVHVPRRAVLLVGFHNAPHMFEGFKSNVPEEFCFDPNTAFFMISFFYYADIMRWEVCPAVFLIFPNPANYFIPNNINKELSFYYFGKGDQRATFVAYFLYPNNYFYCNNQGLSKNQLLTVFTEDNGEEFWAVNSALMMLNCKNIAVKTEKAPRKLNKKRLKSKKRPILDYHTLNVLLPKKNFLKASGSLPGQKKRVHLCRGHFKYYSEDKPLFGKVTGRHWWQPQVRGDQNQGIVLKKYSVKSQEAVSCGGLQV